MEEMNGQTILKASDNYKMLDDYIEKNNIQKILLVCDGSLQYLKINNYFERLEEKSSTTIARFSNFQSNPLYESVVEGMRLFREKACDCIFAVGGGSAMDVAKCIKLYSSSDGDGEDGSFLTQPTKINDVRLLAVPTTAGTGSEATRYAVVYFNGEKQSITDDSIIPDAVLFDTSVLESLPLYQKKSTMLDALCHAIESFWSVNSTDESKRYSKAAIKLILENMNSYLMGDERTYEHMLLAANIAGKAINITQTTAGHAMCYKLTSLYGIAHGHAVAMCVKELWPWMIENTDKCIDPRGQEYLNETFVELEKIMRGDGAMSAIEKFREIVEDLALDTPKASKADYVILNTSVNLIRLKNNPVRLDLEAIDTLYYRILGNEAVSN